MQTEIITYSAPEITLSDDGTRQLAGYYTRYFDSNNAESTQYRVNNYILRIAQGALDSADTSECELRYNHNYENPLGNAESGLKLSLNEKGGLYSHPWDETDPEFIMVEKKLSKKLIGGSSMRFQNAVYEWKKDGDERIMWVKSFGKIVDCGPVRKPAIKGTGQPLILDASFDIENEYNRWLRTRTIITLSKM